jgi:hypothetical protein
MPAGKFVDPSAGAAGRGAIGRSFAFRRAPAARDIEITMKRVAVWGFYAIGALAIGYLALFAYARLTAPQLAPGEPIHIFRKPDAPKYS